jgi:predicted secreted protein
MTTAIRSHGTLLKMGSGGTAGSPISLTSTIHDDLVAATIVLAGAAHGFHDGQVVTIAGVTTATECNGDWPVDVINTLYFSIPVVTTASGASGTATPLAESFTTIGEVGDISGPQLTRETIDVTSHDSPGGFDEYITGLKSSGEVTFKVNWDPSNPTHDGSTGLWKKYSDGNDANFTITNVVGDVLAFAALVTSMGPSFPINGVIQCDMTLKVSGDVVLTPHTP